MSDLIRFKSGRFAPEPHVGGIPEETYQGRWLYCTGCGLGFRIEREREPEFMRAHEARCKPTKICAWCQTVIEKNSEMISHGICAPCADKLEKEES